MNILRCHDFSVTKSVKGQNSETPSIKWLFCKGCNYISKHENGSMQYTLGCLLLKLLWTKLKILKMHMCNKKWKGFGRKPFPYSIFSSMSVDPPVITIMFLQAGDMLLLNGVCDIYIEAYFSMPCLLHWFYRKIVNHSQTCLSSHLFKAATHC